MSDLVVTILTGRRPHLLERTLKSAEVAIGDVLEDARVIAFVNGADDESRAVCRSFPWVDGALLALSWLPIGEATSWCAGFAEPSRYWLHLEDDWECLSAPESWLTESIALLDSGKVDQVRLRDASEKVLKKHMVTGAPINWTQEGHFDIGEAHLTFNPFLMRVSDISDAFPCTGERNAQKKWLAAGHKMVAQHHPGLFRHIGGGESLRGKQA